jgi:alkylation response protein AidB-like acyl-CoA dehydrogenase
MHIEVEVGRTMAYRIAALMNVGYAPDNEASITKLYGSELAQRVARGCTEIMGLYSMLKQGSKGYEQLGGFYGPEYTRSTVGTVVQRDHAEHHRHPRPRPTEGQLAGQTRV